MLVQIGLKNLNKSTEFTLTGNKLSHNTLAAEFFQQRFLEELKELGLNPDQIYNADESGLF
jgi:hypothetical protein